MTSLEIIDDIESLVENSKGGLLGRRLINAEEAIAKIQQLRAALPQSAKALRFTDELEQLIVKSSVRFRGKSLINEEEFFTKIQQLRAALS